MRSWPRCAKPPEPRDATRYPMPMSALICLSTCPDRAAAERIADALVEERLAACVNIVPGLIGTSVRSPVNIAVALSLYGLALMVPTASDAFRSVSRDVLGSATAQGYAPGARFFQVELPLAGPVLLAGVRVVAVSTISLVTVGGVLGVPSLGMLFVDGVRRGIIAEIATGIVLTAALALLTDALLVLLGRAVMPWTRQRETRRP